MSKLTTALESITTYQEQAGSVKLPDDGIGDFGGDGARFLKLLVLDPEAESREEIATILAKQPGIHEVSCFSDSQRAMEVLMMGDIDVLFLGIGGPEMAGMEMLRKARERAFSPAVILVTRNKDLAADAFQQRVVDYILKPFTEARVISALSNARFRLESESALRLLKQFPSMAKQLQSSSPLRLALKSRGRFVFINPDDIEYIQAEGNYVSLQVGNKAYVLRELLKEVERKLAPFGFFRIHKSVIVNASRIAEIQPWFTGEYILRMNTGKEFTLTRIYKKNLSNIVRLTLGAESA